MTFKDILEFQIAVLEAALAERRRELNTQSEANLNAYARDCLNSLPFYVPEVGAAVKIIL